MSELFRAASLRALLAHLNACLQIRIVQVFARLRTAATNVGADLTDASRQLGIARRESGTDVAHIDAIH